MAGHPENNENYLAAELVGEGIDQTIRVTWPDNPLIAKRLFVELEYQFKLRELDDAARFQEAMRRASEEQSKRVKLESPAVLNGLKGRN